MIHKQDLAIANSRPKGGNDSRLYLDHIKALKHLIEQQWQQYPPAWFLTLQWSPAPFHFEGASDHAKHFRNKFLCELYKCSPSKIPPPEERCRLLWFHERAKDHRNRFIYHSHLHLTAPPEPYNSPQMLRFLISRKVAPGFRCLKHLNRKQDPALVIKAWSHENHAHYNFKDYFRHRHDQDADLVFDPERSCLLPV